MSDRAHAEDQATRLRVVVAQLGARQHYAIPRMCHRAGALQRLYTDFWVAKGSRLDSVARLIGPLRGAQRAVGRRSTDIPDAAVHPFHFQSMLWRNRLRRTKSRTETYRVYARQGSSFAGAVARRLRREDFGAFFGFSGAALEAVEMANVLGRHSVLDVTAPIHLEANLVAAEQEAFPGWEPAGGPPADEYLRRLETEWVLARRILVNSEWTKSALVAEGVPAEKVAVVPICYASGHRGTRRTLRAGETLRVLWLGTLCLRKGLPYAVQAAARLVGAPVSFTFVGNANADLSAFTFPANAKYLGLLPRSQVAEVIRRHHIMMAPTLSDGFAITQLEAMNDGMPVITTRNCGEVVEDGVSGRLVATRSADELVQAVLDLVAQPELVTALSNGALRRATQFGPDSIWPLLRNVLEPARITA